MDVKNLDLLFLHLFNSMIQEKHFSERFEYEDTYVDFGVVVYDYSDRSYVSYFKFDTPTFKFSLSDISYSNIHEIFLTGFSGGGNSYSGCRPDGDRFKFYNSVSGRGGDSEFSFSVPMEVAHKMHKLVSTANEYINSCRR